MERKSLFSQNDSPPRIKTITKSSREKASFLFKVLLSCMSRLFFFMEREGERGTMINCIAFVKNYFRPLGVILMSRFLSSSLGIHSSQGSAHKFECTALQFSRDMESTDLSKLMDTPSRPPVVSNEQRPRSRTFALLDVPRPSLIVILICMNRGGGDHTWWFSIVSCSSKISLRHPKIYRFSIRFPVVIGVLFGPRACRKCT